MVKMIREVAFGVTNRHNFQREEELIEFMEEKGHNLSNCEWMVHSNNKIITE